MPKQIDYPRASLRNSLELANAIHELGGKCSVGLAADKLGKKVSGAFQALIGSASRFGLVVNKKGQLESTLLFRNYKLAYSENEAKEALSKAFLTPPLFRSIFDRFEGLQLPLGHFENMLIREFDVPDQISSRVSKYFLDGAKQCDLIGPGNLLQQLSDTSIHDAEDEDEDDSLQNRDMISASSDSDDVLNNQADAQEDILETGKFSVRIKGPGMDSVIVIHEEEDLDIVKAMLKKVGKKLLSSNESTGGNN